MKATKLPVVLLLLQSTLCYQNIQLDVGIP